MATDISTSFLTQGTCGNTGNVMTCIRYDNSGVSSTCDIGGSGSGTNYRNIVIARFDSLPPTIKSAKLKITYQQSGSDYWNAAQTLTVVGCSNFDNNTSGTNRPTYYGSNATGSIAGATASTTIDVTATLKRALLNNSKCLYIYANAADNRKRVASLTLTYEPIDVDTSDGESVNKVIIDTKKVITLVIGDTNIF